MSFQKSAESWRSRAHMSEVRRFSILGSGLVLLVVAVVVCSGFLAATGGRFEVLKDFNNNSVSSVDRGDDRPSSSAATDEEDVGVRIHVGGAVCVPGVYDVPNGSRVIDAITEAGGFADNADSDALNLARLLGDGEQVIIPFKGDVLYRTMNEEGEVLYGVSTGSSCGLININTAQENELMSLPGIGEVTAKKIMRDREKNGPFQSTEDIKRIAGIGEKKYDQLASMISVG